MKNSQRQAGQSASQAEDFETSFGRLQEVVRTLSEGSLSLEDALKSFEEGMGLADRCAVLLEEAELRVKEVSARALRSGNRLAQEQAALDASDLEGAGILALEIEEIEHTILVDADPRHPPSSPQRHRPAPAFEELDPLFDDSD